jgi:hypothetical protein
VLAGEQISELPGARFSSFGDAAIDNLGRVAFLSEIDDGNPDRRDVDTLFVERKGDTKLVAGPDTLPGLATSEVISGFDHLSANASGQLSFSAYFEVPCEDPEDPFVCNDDGGEGLWIVGDDLEVLLVARTGSLIKVSPGDSREIYHVGSFIGSRLNDQGQVTFWAQFLDGTQGVFRAQAVPEPTTGIMLLIGMVTMLTGGRTLVSKLNSA